MAVQSTPSKLSRRTFLGVATAGLLARPGLAEAVREVRLSTRGLDGATPGPALRVRRGAELRVRLINELPEPAAIQWYGVRVPARVGGMEHLLQPPVAPGASFDYSFPPPDAGTFWYRAWVAGRPVPNLFGALVVDEAEPLSLDQDLLLVLGGPPQDVPVRRHERVRIRLLNPTAEPIAVRIDRHEPIVMAIDGEPAEPFPAKDGRVVLGPGNRVDLLLDAKLEEHATAPIRIQTERSEAVLAQLRYGGTARPSPLPAPKPLPANPLPERIPLAGAHRAEFTIGAPTGSLFSVRRGRSVVMAVVNRMQGAAVVHLHGHHFRLLDRLDDGWKPFWLDTLLVPPGQTWRIAFLADNPGRWLIESRNLQDDRASTASYEVT